MIFYLNLNQMFTSPIVQEGCRQKRIVPIIEIQEVFDPLGTTLCDQKKPGFWSFFSVYGL